MDDARKLPQITMSIERVSFIFLNMMNNHSHFARQFPTHPTQAGTTSLGMNNSARKVGQAGRRPAGAMYLPGEGVAPVLN